MADEGFLRRWARRKSEVREGLEPVAGAAPSPAPLAEAPPDAAGFTAPATVAVQAPLDSADEAPAGRPLPTMDDVATLDADSDFSGFVARGVDQAVRRGALKKLFADPHFNVMDRLDVYIDDYNKPSPMSEAMLASLNHAKSVFMKMAGDEPAALAPKAEPQPEQPPEQETQ